MSQLLQYMTSIMLFTTTMPQWSCYNTPIIKMIKLHNTNHIHIDCVTSHWSYHNDGTTSCQSYHNHYASITIIILWWLPQNHHVIHRNHATVITFKITSHQSYQIIMLIIRLHLIIHTIHINFITMITLYQTNHIIHTNYVTMITHHTSHVSMTMLHHIISYHNDYTYILRIHHTNDYAI